MKKEYERPIAELLKFELEEKISSGEDGNIGDNFGTSEWWGPDPFD